MINDMLDITYREPGINLSQLKIFQSRRVSRQDNKIVLVPAVPSPPYWADVSSKVRACKIFLSYNCRNIFVFSVLSGGEHACWVGPAGLGGRREDKYLQDSWPPAGRGSRSSLAQRRRLHRRLLQQENLKYFWIKNQIFFRPKYFL